MKKSRWDGKILLVFHVFIEQQGEQVLIDVTSSFAGLVRSNKTAAFIVEKLCGIGEIEKWPDYLMRNIYGNIILSHTKM